MLSYLLWGVAILTILVLWRRIVGRHDAIFITACRSGSAQEVKNALKSGANINTRGGVSGYTGLMWAAESNTLDVVTTLLDAGADPNAKVEKSIGAGWTALMSGVGNKNNNMKEITIALINAGADVNAKNKYGKTALMIAAGNNNPDVITILLEAGADINARSKGGKTALMYAAEESKNPDVIAALLKAGADVNAKDEEGNCALDYARDEKVKLMLRGLNEEENTKLILHTFKKFVNEYARESGITISDTNFLALCRNGSSEEVARALKAGANVNALDENGETALMTAAYNNGSPEVIAVLLDAGADVNAKGKNGENALLGATSPGNPKVIAMLLNAGADVNTKSAHDMTPLIAATIKGDFEIVSMLLNAGADVNAKSAHDMTPLMVAAGVGNAKLVTALLNAGADLKARNDEGKTAVDIAKDEDIRAMLLGWADKTTEFLRLCEHGSAYEIASALSAGADVNTVDEKGMTALMKACQCNSPDVITALVNAGANVNARDNQGNTALMWAAYDNKNPDIIAALLNAGANVNARDNQGNTTLMWAAYDSENPGIIAALLKAGADVNAKDNEGRTALMRATENGRKPEVITVLLNAGADINAKDEDDETALMKVVRFGNGGVDRKIINILLNAGADVNIKNVYGMNAHDLAEDARVKGMINVIGGCHKNYEPVRYRDVARNPNNFHGDIFTFSGEVMQASEDGLNVTLLVAQDGSKEGRSPDIWYAEYKMENGEDRILEGDHITVYGMCIGSVTYDSPYRNGVAPGIMVDFYDLLD